MRRDDYCARGLMKIIQEMIEVYARIAMGEAVGNVALEGEAYSSEQAPSFGAR